MEQLANDNYFIKYILKLYILKLYVIGLTPEDQSINNNKIQKISGKEADFPHEFQKNTLTPGQQKDKMCWRIYSRLSRRENAIFLFGEVIYKVSL